MIKDHDLYPIYVSYLENKFKSGKLKLAKMSESLFDEFVLRYENEITFRDKQNEIYSSYKRDSNIDDVLDEEIDFDF